MNARQFLQEFAFDFRLDEKELFSDLITIEGYKQAALNLVLPPEWQGQLDRLNRIRAVHGTTAIEGNPFNEAEVGLQLLEAQEEGDSRRTSREQLQIRNADRAQSWVRQRFASGSTLVALEDILTMHRLVTQGSDEGPNVPGQMRSYSVTVGSSEMGGIHYGAPHETLKELMENFIDFLHSRRFQRCHPVIKALLAHFFLVTIHPFGDGNGRVSRLLEAGILFQSDYNVHGFYGLSNYFYRNEEEYKQRLQASRRGKPFDVTPFIAFGVKGFAEELNGINNFVKTKLNRLVYRQMMERNRHIRLSPRRRVLNDRELNLLSFLLTTTEPTDPFSPEASRKVTFAELVDSQYYKGVYSKVTPRTFSRELTRLSNAGFIKFTSGTGEHGPTVELDFGAIAKYSVD